MAPREVNVTISNWTTTGINVQVPQYQATITFNWVRADGTTGTDTRVVKFPNVFQGIPAARLKDYIEQIALAETRIAAGVDN